jgi:hypothetical protein
VFVRIGSPKPHRLDKAINSAIEALEGVDELDPDYSKLTAHLKTLIDLKAIDTDTNRKTQISADQKAAIIANLVGIVAIMSFERTNVITTKAFGFIRQPRI